MNLVKPMLAKSSVMPSQQELYGFEVKWDGIRAITYIENKKLRIISRNGKDITAQYPELHPLVHAVPHKQLILDGEIVALGADGRPSFSRLQQRMVLISARSIAKRMAAIPVTYIIFDLLSLNEQSLLALTYTDRRAQLEALGLTGPNWQTPRYEHGEGEALLLASRKLALEGIIAKKLDSIYEPGKRPGTWLKIKNQQRQEFVIGGWVPGKGKRQATIGALMLGYYDTLPTEAAARGMPQELQYAGLVGTGFTDKFLRKLSALLQPLTRTTSPFTGQAALPDGIFVEPELVCEIEFTEWTPNNTLRHPSFKGLRNDKDAAAVIKEPATNSAQEVQ